LIIFYRQNSSSLGTHTIWENVGNNFIFLNVQLSLAGDGVNPIEALFGSGYICLHISDPLFESSPSFQALARELSKKYNKVSQFVVPMNKKNTKIVQYFVVVNSLQFIPVFLVFLPGSSRSYNWFE